MWISSKVFDWFKISQDSFASIREENAALKAEITALRSELTASRINGDWLRMHYNQMQAENKALLEKAYNVRVPVPSLVAKNDTHFNLQDLFNDVGDEQAHALGLPLYGDKPQN